MEVWRDKAPKGTYDLRAIVNLRIECRGKVLKKSTLTLLPSCIKLRYLELDSVFLRQGDLAVISSLGLEVLRMMHCRWQCAEDARSWRELRVKRLFLHGLRDFELTSFLDYPPLSLTELKISGGMNAGVSLLRVTCLPLKHLHLELTFVNRLTSDSLAYLYTHLQVETLYLDIGPLAYHRSIANNPSINNLTLRRGYGGEQTWHFNPSITTLDLSENMLQRAQHLFSLPALRTLSLYRNMIESLGEAQSALTHNLTLTDLNVSFNKLGTKSLFALKGNRGVAYLDLSHNRLHDEDLEPLIYTEIEHLSLSGNCIQNPYWALARNQSITTYTECAEFTYNPTCLCNLTVRNRALQRLRARNLSRLFTALSLLISRA